MQWQKNQKLIDDPYTDKKEKEIFLIYKDIQMGSVAKSYMRKGFLIYAQIFNHIWGGRCNRSLLIFFFISVPTHVSVPQINLQY